MDNYGDWDNFVRDMYGSREEMYGTAEEDMMPEPMYYESGLEADAREEARKIAAWDDVDPNDFQRKAESDYYSKAARDDDDAGSEPAEWPF